MLGIDSLSSRMKPHYYLLHLADLGERSCQLLTWLIHAISCASTNHYNVTLAPARHTAIQPTGPIMQTLDIASTVNQAGDMWNAYADPPAHQK